MTKATAKTQAELNQVHAGAKALLEEHAIEWESATPDQQYEANVSARIVLDAARATSDWWARADDPANCPDAPHRGPQGPNEDLSQCWMCHLPSWRMRPWGETIGYHLDDCSLPIWHESYCQPGGNGHPPAPKIRG